jgi:hypothetical protein
MTRRAVPIGSIAQIEPPTIETVVADEITTSTLRSV